MKMERKKDKVGGITFFLVSKLTPWPVRKACGLGVGTDALSRTEDPRECT
jgi:hypothetical protein